MLLLIWLGVLIAVTWIYLRQKYKKLENDEIHHLRVIPFLGNLGPAMFKIEHITDTIMKAYQAFPGDRFYGSYTFTKPEIVIRDLELLKKVMVKDFEHFVDRRTLVDSTVEPLMGRNLLALKGDEWKAMRSNLSPAFTSSKIRLMMPFMKEAGDVMIESLKEKIKESKEGYIDIDCKDQSRRCANDVIATCAFGLKVDSNGDDEFYKKCVKLLNFGTWTQIVIFLAIAFPKLTKKLKITVFSREITDFFNNVVLNTMTHREENHIIRNDMIQLLLQAKKGQLSHDSKVTEENEGFATVEESAIGKENININWTDNDLVAQALLFLFAGFDTVSTTLSFALHELAVNPDAQEKLAKEIREHYEQNGKKFDYNSVQQLPYLDMVISETLRLWPPAPVVDRQCMKNYNLGKPYTAATKEYILHKGEYVSLPIWAIHHDPEYFPDPFKFDPERFSEENKHNIKPFSYLPFGLGPRNCIASRFALCELKVIIYLLTLHLELSPCEKTCIPVKLQRDHTMTIKGGHWIRMKLRK